MTFIRRTSRRWAGGWPSGPWPRRTGERWSIAVPCTRPRRSRGGKVRLYFAHTGSGLAVRGDGPLNWFEIAGKDGPFVKAQATIEGNTVLVWSEEVHAPTDVRFGWHQEAEPNLMNAEGLPASPFRTDRRPLLKEPIGSVRQALRRNGPLCAIDRARIEDRVSEGPPCLASQLVQLRFTALVFRPWGRVRW